MSNPSHIRTPLIPCLTYRDARSAIDWLCKTFGFEQIAAYEGENDSIVHAELSFGNGMVMISSVDKNRPFGRLIAQPDELGGRETQTTYVIAQQLEEIYRRVQSSGVEVLLPLEAKDYGGSSFTCRDVEGHIWSFGTYDPWETKR